MGIMPSTMIKKLYRLYKLCTELDAELDGVKLPSSAAAILNGICAVLDEIKEEEKKTL